MNELYYIDFLDAMSKGIKSKAKSSIILFIKSFNTDEEKIKWVRDFLQVENIKEGRIRHELFQLVVFPVLLEGFKRDDPWAIKWIILLIQNIYSDKKLHKELGYETELSLSTKLYRLNPQDSKAKELKLKHLLNYLNYCFHEWPSGVLAGINGATLDECNGIKESIEELIHLSSDMHIRLIAKQYQEYLNEYKKRLLNKKISLK